jgi:macrolide-specific efflux system membrane fusion protein
MALRTNLHRLRHRRVALAVAVLVLAAGGTAWATTRGGSSASAATEILATASKGTVRQTVSTTGTLVPARQADLSFTVSGTVRTVAVSVGDTVGKGQVLAKVGAAALKADLAAARSSTTAARSQLSSDLADGASDAQIAADRAGLRSARTARAAARDALDAASLTATVAGTVAAVELAVGDQVGGSGGSGDGSTSSDSSSSSAQVTIISTDAYDVDASVTSSDLVSVKKGLQVEITPTGSDQTLYGTVSSVGLVAESSTTGSSTFPVEIAVTGKVEGVYAGSSADVAIIVKQLQDVLTVPTAAVRTDDTGATAVTVSANGRQVVTPVTIGDVVGSQTVVTDGLAEGDQVVVTTLRLPSGDGGGGTGERPQGVFPGGGPQFQQGGSGDAPGGAQVGPGQ